MTGRGSVRAFFTNWRDYDAPFTRKLRLTIRNQARKARGVVTEGTPCCGHPGEPGC